MTPLLQSKDLFCGNVEYLMHRDPMDCSLFSRNCSHSCGNIYVDQ